MKAPTQDFTGKMATVTLDTTSHPEFYGPIADADKVFAAKIVYQNEDGVTIETDSGRDVLTWDEIESIRTV